MLHRECGVYGSWVPEVVGIHEAHVRSEVIPGRVSCGYGALDPLASGCKGPVMENGRCMKSRS